MNPHQSLEVEARESGYRGWILGVDEVGRGPLAGPATVACVAFPCECDAEFPLFAELDDSKKLTARRRDRLVPRIEASSAAWALLDVSPEKIDELNILHACLWGMRQVVREVAGRLGGGEIQVFVDGNQRIPELEWAQTPYVKGDARSWSIAAASILAKVHRDALMVEYDALYPGYGFASNVGYPTAAHRAALRELGPTPIHRRSFHVK